MDNFIGISGLRYLTLEDSRRRSSRWKDVLCSICHACLLRHHQQQPSLQSKSNSDSDSDNKQELSKPRLATPLHACVLVTYLLIYLGTYLFTRLLTRYVLQPLLYKLSKIVLI